MMKLLSVISFLLLFSCSSTPSDPIEEKKQQQALMERCNKLKKEIIALKGKPVRRNAAIKYYESECSSTNVNPHSIQ